VHLLVSKEIKAGKTEVKDELSDDKKRKIKYFVKDYMDKVMARRAQKLASKQQESVPGHPDSASTATPLVPGSEQREGEVKESVTEATSMSPPDFQNKTDMDGLLDKG